MSETTLYPSHSRSRALTEGAASAGILSVSSFFPDQIALRYMLGGLPGRLITASTCAEAREHLEQARIALVLCDRNLRDGTWRDVLNILSNSPEPPLLIVTSDVADAHLWAEVLNLGGYDVIAKPFRKQEVQHIVQTAWERRNAPIRSRHSAGGASGRRGFDYKN